MQPGREYRPIIDEELMRTSVYAIQVESWSGKRNWKEQADQSPDWPALEFQVTVAHVIHLKVTVTSAK